MFSVSELRVQPRVGLSKANAGGAFFCPRFPEKRRSKDTWEQFSNTTGPDHPQVGSCPLGGLNDSGGGHGDHCGGSVEGHEDPQESSGSEVAAGPQNQPLNPSHLCDTTPPVSITTIRTKE